MNEGEKMVAALATTQSKSETLERVLIQGDLSKLTPDERVSYYRAVCDSVGLNPLTKPFDYLQLSGKTVLYAKRDATDQLRKIHGVSIRIANRESIEGVYVVTASATDKTGRIDESTGAVTISNLKGDQLANALMKAETKAKRRVTLSICGLGLLDETEIETIPAVSHDAGSAPRQLPSETPVHISEPVDAVLDDVTQRNEPSDREDIEEQVFRCITDIAGIRGKKFDDAYWHIMRHRKWDYASLADVPYGQLRKLRDDVVVTLETMQRETATV